MQRLGEKFENQATMSCDLLPSPWVGDISAIVFREGFENANNLWDAASEQRLKIGRFA